MGGVAACAVSDDVAKRYSTDTAFCFLARFVEYRPHDNQDLGSPLQCVASRLLQAAKVGAQAQLVQDCRTLLKRLTAEVEISKAITCFPTVRLPIDVRRAAKIPTFLDSSRDR